MSIYATLNEFYVPKLPLAEPSAEDFIRVRVQAVPAHIDYTGPEWDFLPPPVAEESGYFRAVFVCGPDTTKGTERSGQEYVGCLLAMTGEEYARTSWDDMWTRIEDALEPILRQAREEHNRVTRAELESRRRQVVSNTA